MHESTRERNDAVFQAPKHSRDCDNVVKPIRKFNSLGKTKKPRDSIRWCMLSIYVKSLLKNAKTSQTIQDSLLENSSVVNGWASTTITAEDP